MIKRIQIFLAIIIILLLSAACDAKREQIIQGRTMGTTYHVTVVTGWFQPISGLQEAIELRLKEINQSMSTYIHDSEISRFNRFQRAGRPFPISSDFFEVMKMARTIYRLSNGAWDGTVSPLITLWGFGPETVPVRVPPPQQIAARRSAIGFADIEVKDPGILIKKRADIALDLSSIAKGYGVDQVAAVIRSRKFDDYLVEIGGEVVASGRRGDGKLWRVGINQPRPAAGANEVYRVVDLDNAALATSGDYRNFFTLNGIRYSHVIDPKIGYPVSNSVVSVSIIADSCTFADGLATAIMVMGAEKGLRLLNRLEEVEGLIVLQELNDRLVDYASDGFGSRR
jgi:thiamine biosynthesis lipoprotein